MVPIAYLTDCKVRETFKKNIIEEVKELRKEEEEREKQREELQKKQKKERIERDKKREKESQQREMDRQIQAVGGEIDMLHKLVIKHTAKAKKMIQIVESV